MNSVACIYDNPVTLSRELWQNGKVVYSLSLFFLETQCHLIRPRRHGKCITALLVEKGVFSKGTATGDLNALDESIDKEAILSALSDEIKRDLYG